MKIFALIALLGSTAAIDTIYACDKAIECQGEMWLPHCTEKLAAASPVDVRDEGDYTTEITSEAWTAITQEDTTATFPPVVPSDRPFPSFSSQEDTTTLVPPMDPSERPFPSFSSSAPQGNPSDVPDPHLIPPMVPSNRPFPNPTSSPVLTEAARRNQVSPPPTTLPYTCSSGSTTDYRGRCYATTYSKPDPVTTTSKTSIATPPAESTSFTYTCSPGSTTDYRGHCRLTPTTDEVAVAAVTTTSSVWESTIPVDYSTSEPWIATIQTVDLLARAADASILIHSPLAQHTPPSCIGPACSSTHSLKPTCIGPACSTTLITSVVPTSAGGD